MAGRGPKSADPRTFGGLRPPKPQNFAKLATLAAKFCGVREYSAEFGPKLILFFQIFSRFFVKNRATGVHFPKRKMYTRQIFASRKFATHSAAFLRAF